MDSSHKPNILYLSLSSSNTSTELRLTAVSLVISNPPTLKYRENGAEGLEMVRHNNNRGVGIIGGGLLGEMENSPFLR